MNNYQYIKDELDRQNRSISWLAQEIGVSKGYVSKILNNKISEPGNTKIIAIHQVLNIQKKTEKYEKTAYLIDVDNLSIEKYLHVAMKTLDKYNDIYLLFNSKSVNKEVNLRRFYDFLNFSNANIVLVTESELKKQLNKKSYTEIVTFNNEFSFLKGYDFTNVEILNEEILHLRKINNKSILILSNNQTKLSIVLNVLKLKTSYLIDDFAIFKDVSSSGNALINNQLNVLEQINKLCQTSRLYITGNEYLALVQNNQVSELKKQLINYDKYLDLFDLIINIDFDDNDDNERQLFTNNSKIIKSAKAKSIIIKQSDISLITNEIIKKMEENNYED